MSRASTGSGFGRPHAAGVRQTGGMTALLPATGPLPDSSRWPTDRPFNIAEARALGLSTHELTRAVTVGVLRRPIRGVYADASLADSLKLRAAVLRLIVPSGSFVADRTAAWLHGADMALAPGDHLALPPLTVFRVPSRTRLRNPVVEGGRRTVEPGDLCVVHGLVATTPLRTALDLGRLQHRDLAIAGMDALAAAGAFTAEALDEELGRFRGARGVRQLRALVPLVDPRAQSGPESAMRLRWHDAGLPWPDCQVPVERPGGRWFFVDVGRERDRTGAEYDGVLWHGDEQHAHDEARRLWLREEAGWHIVVLRRDNVYGRDQDAIARLRELWRGRPR